jgi:hypothetical protein
MCSMIFRSFALIVLAAVAPVALMLMPWEKTKSLTRRWTEIVVALLLAKPLAATVLAVAIKLFAESKSFAGLAAGTVGMALACAAPMMALRLVSFAGGELAAAAQTAGGGHVLSRSSGFAARQISRQTGGRFTLAALASRSAMNRPIQSSRPDFPTRTLPPRAPLPGTGTGTTPSQTSGGGGTAVMLDAGPSPSGHRSPHARKGQETPRLNARTSPSGSMTGANLEPERPPSLQSSTDPKAVPASSPPVRTLNPRHPIVQPPKDGDSPV